jgi:hypothetical protein
MKPFLTQNGHRHVTTEVRSNARHCNPHETRNDSLMGDRSFGMVCQWPIPGRLWAVVREHRLRRGELDNPEDLWPQCHFVRVNRMNKSTRTHSCRLWSSAAASLILGLAALPSLSGPFWRRRLCWFLGGVAVRRVLINMRMKKRRRRKQTSRSCVAAVLAAACCQDMAAPKL